MAGEAVIGRVSVKVIPDTKNFRNKAKAELARIEKGLEVKAQLVVDLQKASIERAKKQLDDAFDKVKAEIHTDVNAASRAASQTSLARLARARRVELLPFVNKGAAAKAGTTLAALSGGRVLSAYISDIGTWLSKLDKETPKMAALGLAIANLGGYALTASSNLFALSQSLAQIGPAALALPGIFAGLAIGAGAFVAVIKDFPSIFPDIKSRLADLQDQMSEKFWAKAEAPMRRMIDTLLPQFSKGLRNTSTALGDFIASLSDGFTNALDGRINPMFDNLNESIRVASLYTGNLADIIATLGTTGSAYLPRLAKFFGGLLKSFDAFISAAANDGRLNAWIETGITQMRELGRAIAGIGSILAGLAKAAEAAGGSTLTIFADTLQRVADVVNGPAFQDGLISVLKAAHEGMSRLSETSGPGVLKLFEALSRVLSTILPIAGESFGTLLGGIADGLSRISVQQGVIDFFEGVRSGIEGFVPYLPQVADGIGALLGLAGKLADVTIPLLGKAFGYLGDIASTLAPALEPVIDVLGSMVDGVLDAIGPVLVDMADDLARMVEGAMPVLEQLGNTVVDVFREVGPVLGDIVDKTADAFLRLAPVLADFFQENGPGIAKAMGDLAEAFVPVVDAVLRFAEQVLPPLLAGLGAVIGMSGGLQVVGNIIAFVIDCITDFFQAVEFIGGVIGTAIGYIVLFVQWLTTLGDTASNLGRTVSEGLGDALDFVVGLFTTTGPRMVQAFQASASRIGQQAQMLGSQVVNNVRNGLSRVPGIVSQFMSQAASAAGRLASQAVSSVRSTFARFPDGIRQGVNRGVQAIQAGIGQAASAARQIGSAAVSAVRGFAGEMYSVGLAMIQGLGNGIMASAGSIASKAAGVVRNAIAAAKAAADINSPSRVMRDEVGKQMGAGMADGLRRSSKSVEDEARRSVKRAIRGATAEQKRAIKSLAKTLRTAGYAKRFVADDSALSSQFSSLVSSAKATGNAAALAIAQNYQKAMTRYVYSSRAKTVSGKFFRGDLAQLQAEIQKAQQAYSQALQAAAQARAQVMNSIIGSGDIGQVQRQSFAGIVHELTKAKDRAYLFNQAISKLTKAKLGKTALQQLINAGPDALEKAQAILASGSKGIQQINSLQAQLAKSAANIAAQNYNLFYKVGVDSSRGILVGLQREMPKLQKQMELMAWRMVKAIKKALKIKSPSRVFRDLGGHVGQGFANGIDGMKNEVARALDRTIVQVPRVSGNASFGLAGRVGSSAAQPKYEQKNLHYYAAPGSSLGSEEDLFAAAGRARMGWK